MFLGETKEKLAEAAADPELVEGLKHFVEDCRTDIGWAEAVAGYSNPPRPAS